MNKFFLSIREIIIIIISVTISLVIFFFISFSFNNFSISTEKNNVLNSYGDTNEVKHVQESIIYSFIYNNKKEFIDGLFSCKDGNFSYSDKIYFSIFKDSNNGCTLYVKDSSNMEKPVSINCYFKKNDLSEPIITDLVSGKVQDYINNSNFMRKNCVIN